MKSLQETYAPNNVCFGCGPANPYGLHLRSFADGDELAATFQPQLIHQAFEGILNGGIIGTLLDCHCNWMAAYYFMKQNGAATPPCTVTAEYTIKMRRPTPVTGTLELRSQIIRASERRAVVAGTLSIEGVVTANCEGIFVAVMPGHPAYHRW